MPLQNVDRNWLPSLALVLALHVAAGWGVTHFKSDTTRPVPLPVVNVTLLPPPEQPQPRVIPPSPQPEPPKPRQQPQVAPQPTPQPIQRPNEVAAAPTPAVVEEAKPTQPIAPVAVAAPPTPPAPAPEPAVEPPRYNAAYLSNPPPAYPLAARRRGVEGTALVRAEISAGGECLRAELKKSSGAEMLDQAALEAVKKWRFVPARRGSQALVAWVEVPITFKLDN